MKKDTSNAKSGRRNFLLALGAGGAASAATVIGAGLATKNTLPASGDNPAGKGYQDTEHVRNYYRSTRV